MTSPVYVRVDVSSACQLRCPTCPTGLRQTHDTIGAGFMKAADFEQLLEENPRIRHVEISNWGEIFLNPELPDILRIAHSRRVKIYADNGVNLNFASPEALRAVVQYDVRTITCSIDGATDETYAIYRQGGKLSDVLDNIARINAYKKQFKSRFPRLIWQFIPFEHNIHELAAARKLAQSLGMAFFPKLSWGQLHTPASAVKPANADEVKKSAGISWGSRSEYHERQGREYMQREICSQLWNAPQINWDGRVLGCCVNHWGDFGTVKNTGLQAALEGEKLNYAKHMLLGKETPRKDIPCTTCTHYQAMARTGNWLSRGYILRNRFNWWLILTFIGSPRRIWHWLARMERGISFPLNIALIYIIY